MTDRHQPYHMLSASSSAAEYACTDCGRTFRRHATYRRHRLQSHDDVIQTTGKHLPPMTSPSRRSPCAAIAVSCGRSLRGVEVETEQVDDEISIGETSSGANELPPGSGEEINAIYGGRSGQQLAKGINIPRRDSAAAECKNSSATCAIKIEQTDDASLDGDEELADFRTPSETNLSLNRPSSIACAVAKTEAGADLANTKNVAHASPPNRVKSMVAELTNPIRQLSSPACKQEIDCELLFNNGRQLKDERSEEIKGVMKNISTAPMTIGTPSATVVTSSATQKIFVYVKTESQVPFCNGTAAVVSNSCPNGLMTMMSDDQLVQPLMSNAKPAGCQFICPICQRLFNSEKYLSMHISSIHRTPDVGLQQQQQNAKQVATIEVVSAPTLSPPSAVVATVTTTRRTQGHHASRTVTAAVPASAPAANSPQHHITTVPLTMPSVMAVPSAAVSQPVSTTTGGGSSVVVGPTRTSTQWTCNICNKSFAQNSSYKNHIRTHSDDRPYVCSICSIGFKERYHLKKHALFKHTTELNETCRVCGKRFKDSTAVRAHERIHSDVRPYGCTLCGKTFKTSECLWHHENRSKTCGKMAVAAAAAAAAVASGTVIGVDGRTAVRRQNMQQQQQQQQNSRLAMTSGPKRQRRNQLTAPTAAARQLPIMQPSTTMEEVQSAVSVIAKEQLNDPALIEAQVISTVSALTTATPVVKSCQPPASVGDVALTNVKQQLTVNKTIHGLDDVDGGFCEGASTNGVVVVAGGGSVTLATTPSVDSIDCELFNDVKLSSMFDGDEDVGESALVDEFWQHFDMDQMTSEYCCDIDAADTDVIDSASSTTETASSSSNDDSESSAAAVEELTKEIAMTAARFSSASSVDSSPADGSSTSTTVGRMSTAAAGSAKRHDCARCDKRFASAATLEKHLLVHAEVRPYRCSVCDIGFKLKVHLKKHNLYRHSDDYPCECSVCGKRFKDSSAVRLHERIHSADRPFQCLHCGKSFKTKENLWGHRNRGPCDKSASSGSMVAAPNGATTDISPRSSPPVGPVLLDTNPSSTVAAADVTQHFVANNVRLFHSAEFGPILGVPVNARLVFREVIESTTADKTAVAVADGCKNSTSSGVSSSSSNGGQTMTSSQSLSAGLPRLTAAVAGQHDVASPKSGQPPRVVVMSTATNAVTSPVLPAVPTAVVAPIKRQTTAGSVPPPDGSATSSTGQNRPTSLLCRRLFDSWQLPAISQSSPAVGNWWRRLRVSSPLLPGSDRIRRQWLTDVRRYRSTWHWALPTIARGVHRLTAIFFRPASRSCSNLLFRVRH
jgi:uncharacterized Zn-finger protein